MALVRLYVRAEQGLLDVTRPRRERADGELTREVVVDEHVGSLDSSLGERYEIGRLRLREQQNLDSADA